MVKVLMMSLFLLPSALRSRALFEALGDSGTAQVYHHLRMPVFSAVPVHYKLSTGIADFDSTIMVGFGFHNLDTWTFGAVSSVDYLMLPKSEPYHFSMDNAVSISFFGNDLYKVAIGYRSHQYWPGFPGLQEPDTWFISWSPTSDLNLGNYLKLGN